MGRPFFSARYLVVFSSIVAFGIASVSGQQPAPPKPAAPAAGPQQGIYLVFPFENAGVAPRLEWLGEGLEELTIQRLSAAGEQVYSHAGRLVELERYGLPPTSKFSRPTLLHLAEDLEADFEVCGRPYRSSSTSRPACEYTCSPAAESRWMVSSSRPSPSHSNRGATPAFSNGKTR